MKPRTVHITKPVIHCARCGRATLDPKRAPLTVWANLPLCADCLRAVSVGPQEFKEGECSTEK